MMRAMKVRTSRELKDHRSVARNSPTHRSLARGAARQALRLLSVFEKERPYDDRPRLAVEAIRAWGSGERELGMAVVRKLSLDAHAAARAARTDTARFAARAAGQAVATWHVPNHALGVPYYARKIAIAKADMKRPDKKVTAYIAAAPKEARPILKRLRAIVRQAAPEAKEGMRYGMPGYELHGRPLVYFGSFAKHVGVYALGRSLPATLREKLRRYAAAGASLRFPHDAPFPEAAVKRLIGMKAKMLRSVIGRGTPRRRH